MGTRPEIPLSRGGGALGCRTCGTGSHVRHGIGTCGPTGAKLPSQGLLEGPGQKSPSHKALEHWDAPVRNQRAKPLVGGAKMLGFSFWHSHVWHGLARGRSARVGCECYVRNLVFFRSKMPNPLFQNNGLIKVAEYHNRPHRAIQHCESTRVGTAACFPHPTPPPRHGPCHLHHRSVRACERLVNFVAALDRLLP